MNAADRPLRAEAPLGRRELLVGGALAAAAVGAALLGRSTRAAAARLSVPLDRQLPDRLASWSRAPSSGVLIPRAEDTGSDTYDDVATAYYVSPRLPAIMFLLAYGSAQTGTTQLHRPEVCYPSAGFEVSGGEALSIPPAGIAGRALSARAPGRDEQILYWTRVGDRFATSNLDQQWSVFRDSLSGNIPDGALVRMSLLGPSLAAALPVLEHFARELVAAAAPKLRSLLVGRA
ncbi:EpsI family protein [Sphingomonas ginkgonis]|uniref:EpsI family protein n=1 Tax=Sphingomonas ginkgonis TaxID=2315330 RepID=A0A429VBU2_9SPHN|nr:exosortase C-terminal domain/associated protein EpsI [Sphingomonas ginkgonis]RST31455.1 EpsI family protein [Sphingomonas ginkgonis]